MNRERPPSWVSDFFVVDHLADTDENRRLISCFSAGRNAAGLARYLKEDALDDEKCGEARTYLVKNTGTGELACYFSLRACLVPLSFGTEIVTVPAIELANFAVNESSRTEHAPVKRIGAYVFLHFILPLSRYAASYIGAKWLCIYALPHRQLLDYYEKTLGFSQLPEKHAKFVYDRIKPSYDEGCIFMFQPLEAL